MYRSFVCVVFGLKKKMKERKRWWWHVFMSNQVSSHQSKEFGVIKWKINGQQNRIEYNSIIPL